MVVVLLVTAVVGLQGRREPRWVSVAFLSTAANMFFVGVFFNIALRWTLPADANPWVNEAVHVLLPLYALADGLLAPHRRFPMRAMGCTAVLGVGWTICTQLRGPVVVDPASGEAGWYPYDFVDPASVPGGTLGAIVISVTLTGVITALGFGMAVSGRRVQRLRRSGRV